MIPPDAGVAQELQELFRVAQDMQTARYIDVICYTLILYDVLITLSQEYALIWNGKGIKGKILYFCVRYPVVVEGALFLAYGFSTTNSAAFCETETHISAWGTLVLMVPLQMIVIIRTTALWQNRNITGLLIFTCVGADIVSTVTISRLTVEEHYAANPLLQPLLGCIGGLSAVPQTLTLPSWGAMITFDSLVFILTLIKAVHTYHSQREDSLRTPLRTVLIRDGFLYYAVMLAVALANLIVFCTLQAEDVIVAAGISLLLRVSFSIIGSRLMINMRDVNTRELYGEGTFNTSKSISWRVRTDGTTTGPNEIELQLEEGKEEHNLKRIDLTDSI